jgi:hypothetical protein
MVELESSVEHEEHVADVLPGVLHHLAVEEGGDGSTHLLAVDEDIGGVSTVLAEHVDELLPHLERGAAGARRWDVEDSPAAAARQQLLLLRLAAHEANAVVLQCRHSILSPPCAPLTYLIEERK